MNDVDHQLSCSIDGCIDIARNQPKTEDGIKCCCIMIMPVRIRPNNTKTVIQGIGWEVVPHPHPSYFPHLVLSDIHLYCYLPTNLRGLSTDNETALRIWLEDKQISLDWMLDVPTLVNSHTVIDNVRKYISLFSFFLFMSKKKRKKEKWQWGHTHASTQYPTTWWLLILWLLLFFFVGLTVQYFRKAFPM